MDNTPGRSGDAAPPLPVQPYSSTREHTVRSEGGRVGHRKRGPQHTMAETGQRARSKQARACSLWATACTLIVRCSLSLRHRSPRACACSSLPWQWKTEAFQMQVLELQFSRFLAKDFATWSIACGRQSGGDRGEASTGERSGPSASSVAKPRGCGAVGRRPPTLKPSPPRRDSLSCSKNAESHVARIASFIHGFIHIHTHDSERRQGSQSAARTPLTLMPWQ